MPGDDGVESTASYGILVKQLDDMRVRFDTASENLAKERAQVKALKHDHLEALRGAEARHHRELQRIGEDVEQVQREREKMAQERKRRPAVPPTPRPSPKKP